MTSNKLVKHIVQYNTDYVGKEQLIKIV